MKPPVQQGQRILISAGELRSLKHGDRILAIDGRPIQLAELFVSWVHPDGESVACEYAEAGTGVRAEGLPEVIIRSTGDHPHVNDRLAIWRGPRRIGVTRRANT